MNAMLFDTARDTIESIYHHDNLLIAIYRQLSSEQKNQLKAGVSKIVGVNACHINMTPGEVTNLTVVYANGTATQLETLRQAIKTWIAGYLETNACEQVSLF